MAVAPPAFASARNDNRFIAGEISHNAAALRLADDSPLGDADNQIRRIFAAHFFCGAVRAVFRKKTALVLKIDER